MVWKSDVLGTLLMMWKRRDVSLREVTSTTLTLTLRTLN